MIFTKRRPHIRLRHGLGSMSYIKRCGGATKNELKKVEKSDGNNVRVLNINETGGKP